MTHQQKFVLVFTFIVGLMSGAYVYINGFAPNYSNDGVEDASEKSALIVRGERFGGCQMAGNICASFELTDNRKYRYIPQHSINGPTPEAITGTISRDVYADVAAAVQRARFADLNAAGGSCNAAADGTDYKYEIVIERVSYRLNSCSTVFGTDPFYSVLLSVWNEIENRDGASGDFEGVGELLIDQFGGLEASERE